MQHAMRGQFDLYFISLAQLKMSDDRGVKTTRATITAEDPGAASLAACTARANYRGIHLNGGV